MTVSEVDKENAGVSKRQLDFLDNFSLSENLPVESQKEIFSLFFAKKSSLKLDDNNALYAEVMDFLSSAISNQKEFRQELFTTKRDYILGLIRKHCKLSVKKTLQLILTISKNHTEISIYSLIELLENEEDIASHCDSIYEIYLNISTGFREEKIEFDLFFKFFMVLFATKIDAKDRFMENFTETIRESIDSGHIGAKVDSELLVNMSQFIPSIWICPHIVVSMIIELEKIFKERLYIGDHFQVVSHFTKCFFKPEIHNKFPCVKEESVEGEATEPCILDRVFLMLKGHITQYYETINPEETKIFDVIFSVIRIPPICKVGSRSRLDLWWTLLNKMPKQLLVKFPNRYLTPFLANLIGKYISLTETPAHGQIFKYKLGQSNVKENTPFAKDLCLSLFSNISQCNHNESEEKKLFTDQKSLFVYLKKNFRVCLNSFFTYLDIREDPATLHLLPHLTDSFLEAFLTAIESSEILDSEKILVQEYPKNLVVVLNELFAHVSEICAKSKSDKGYSEHEVATILGDLSQVLIKHKSSSDKFAEPLAYFKVLLLKATKFEMLNALEKGIHDKTSEEDLDLFSQSVKVRLHYWIESEPKDLQIINTFVRNCLRSVETSTSHPEPKAEDLVEVIGKEKIQTALRYMKALEIYYREENKPIINEIIDQEEADETQFSQIITPHNVSNVTLLVVLPCFFSTLFIDENLSEIKETMKQLFENIYSKVDLTIQLESNQWLEALAVIINGRIKSLAHAQSKKSFELIGFLLDIVTKTMGKDDQKKVDYVNKVKDDLEEICQGLEDSGQISATPKRTKNRLSSVAPMSVPSKRSSRLSLKNKNDEDGQTSPRGKGSKRNLRKRSLFLEEAEEGQEKTEGESKIPTLMKPESEIAKVVVEKGTPGRKPKRQKVSETITPHEAPVDCDENAVFVDIAPKETTMTPHQREKIKESKKSSYIPSEISKGDLDSNSNSIMTQDELKVAEIKKGSFSVIYIPDDSQSNNSQIWHDVLLKNKQRLENAQKDQSKNEEHNTNEVNETREEDKTLVPEPDDQQKDQDISPPSKVIEDLPEEMIVPETQEELIPKAIGSEQDVVIPESNTFTQETLPTEENQSPKQTAPAPKDLDHATPDRGYEFKEEMLQTTPKAVFNTTPKSGVLNFKGNVSRSQRILNLALDISKNKRSSLANNSNSASVKQLTGEKEEGASMLNHSFDSIPSLDYNRKPKVTRSASVYSEKSPENSSPAEDVEGKLAESVDKPAALPTGILKGISSSNKQQSRRVSFSAEVQYRLIEDISSNKSPESPPKQHQNKRKTASPQRHPLSNEKPDRINRRNSLTRNVARLAEPILNISIGDDDQSHSDMNNYNSPALTSDAVVSKNNKKAPSSLAQKSPPQSTTTTTTGPVDMKEALETINNLLGRVKLFEKDPNKINQFLLQVHKISSSFFAEPKSN